MHHVVVEGWSRRRSPLHARDARAKLGVLLVFLIAVSTTPAGAWSAMAGQGLLLAVAAGASRLPIRGLAARAALVLPFSGTFALLTWLAGDATLATTLAAKAFVSAFAALLLVATTPMADLTAALETLRVPRTLVMVIQFLYRYLFTISEQAQHMRLAARARGGAGRAGASRFRAAAGALGVLFVRSWERAEGVYSAMLARGFRGHIPLFDSPHFHTADFLFLYGSVAATLAIRLVL
jgi:cobalt/nickel transport system permease protein